MVVVVLCDGLPCRSMFVYLRLYNQFVLFNYNLHCSNLIISVYIVKSTVSVVSQCAV